MFVADNIGNDRSPHSPVGDTELIDPSGQSIPTQPPDVVLGDQARRDRRMRFQVPAQDPIRLGANRHQGRGSGINHCPVDGGRSRWNRHRPQVGLAQPRDQLAVAVIGNQHQVRPRRLEHRR